MVIIEKNLAGLATQYSVCDPTLIENFCLSVRLGNQVYRPKKSSSPATTMHVVFDHTPAPATLFEELEHIDQNLTLAPGEAVLACSNDIYVMPNNYFGLLQTKGTLARLFVSITCNDGQIEPGFKGKITFEIVNLSPWNVSIPSMSKIGQLYLIRCSSASGTPYAGRYSETAEKGPTIPIWRR